MFNITRLPATTGDIRIENDLLPGTMTPALRVDAGPGGGRVLFRARPGQVGDERWTADRTLVLPVHQGGDHALFLHLLFWEQGERDDLPHADIAMGVFPGMTVQVVLPLKALDLQTLFLPRTPGRLKNVSLGTPVAPEKVATMAVLIPPSAAPQTVWLGFPGLFHTVPAHRLPAEPVVDTLGQWKRKEWPGKTPSVPALVKDLRHRCENPPAPLEGEFDRFGGWTARKLEATGFFRTERDGERWWLVDPEGHPFFSAGVDCVSPHAPGPVAGLESLFERLPERTGSFAAAWREGGGDADSHEDTKSRNHEEGRNRANKDQEGGNAASRREAPATLASRLSPLDSAELSFATVNLIRAFGDTALGRWEEMTARQLRAWGFNTVGNWSEPGLGPRIGMPYVTTLPDFPRTRATIFRDLPDVFSPEYAADAERCALALDALAGDPLLIGYFLTNEPNWAFGAYNLGEMVLASPAELATRERLIAFLSERYEGDVARLSTAWGRPFGAWEDLRAPIERAAALSPAAAADLEAFNAVVVEQFVRVPAEAACRRDPHHLNLGLRWAWVASDAFFAGAQYCDVFSINHYQMRPDPAEIGRIARATGLPVLIGEFHAGALDVGLPANALRGVATQHDRGLFYRHYMEHAAALPDLIGAHYFQWLDQPVLGRFDGECLNIGLLDVCHRPYAPMIAGIMEAHRRLYPLHAALAKPTAEAPVELPREGF